MKNIGLDELVIALVGYATVFLALVTLYGLFSLLPKLIYMNFKRYKLKRGENVKEHQEMLISGDETAAIAMALHLVFDEMHDEESGVLTIKNIAKTYSPWSSKIYAVRNQFNRL